jgi:hypothetical protein
MSILSIAAAADVNAVTYTWSSEESTWFREYIETCLKANKVLALPSLLPLPKIEGISE